MKIASWNLAGPKMSRPRAQRLRNQVLGGDGIETEKSIDADVLVLTETHSYFDLSPEYYLAASSSPADDRSGDERWVSIWVRAGLEANRVDSAKTERTACILLSAAGAADWYVYGTVLPWHGDKRHTPAIGSSAFNEALSEQERDWIEINATAPEARLLVAGDFNQDLLDEGHYYGSHSRRKALREALGRAKLECLTGGVTDPGARLIKGHASIDHICVSQGQGNTLNEAIVWPKTAQLRRGLSDHFGVMVSLDPS